MHPAPQHRTAIRRFAKAFTAASSLVLAASLVIIVTPAQAAPGDLDSSFSGDGRQTTDFGGDESGSGVAIQADGKILVVGGQDGNFALARYDTDGALDSTFSSDGRQTTDFGGQWDAAFSVAVQPDGEIVAVGSASGDFALARYRPDGSLDASFSDDGKQTTDFGESTDEAAGVALQPDGKIVAVGYTFAGAYAFALARYNPDGSLDNTFSGDGLQTTGFGGGASGVVVQGDGKIVAVGGTGSDFWSLGDFALARYNAEGSLDATFSEDGLQTTDFGGDDAASDDAVADVALQSDGKIVAVGYGVDWGYDLALARYSADGSLDVSFSDDGKQTTDLNARDGASGVALQGDGKIVAVGHAGVGVGPGDFALTRYDADGSLDAGLSGDGTQTTDFGSDDAANSVALQSDGKIVAVGVTGPVSGGRNFALARYEGRSGAAEPGTPPTNLSAPTISGSGIEGQTLTASAGSWSGSVPITLSHQWRRCDSTGANCVEIAAATATTYTPSAADVGHTIRVRETAANAYGTGSVDSAATAVVRARLGAIAGTVYSASRDTAIAGASVSCGGGYSAKTGSTGTYSIANVAPGGYSCTASAKHHTPLTQTVRVDSGQTSTTDFTLVRR